MGGFADELTPHRRRRPRGEDPVDPVVHLAADPLRRPWGPREPRPREGVGVGVAERVPEAGLREGDGHGPGDRVRNVRTRRGDRLGPVEMGRAVEVPREEDRDALRDEPRQDADLILDLGEPEALLQGEDVFEGGPRLGLVRAVRVRRQMDVREGRDAARQELDEDVDPVSAGRVEERVTGDDLHALARVPAESLGDPPRVHDPFLDPDDVRAGCPDRLDDLGEGLLAAFRAGAVVQRGEIELVASVEDVEGHHPERDAPRGGARARIAGHNEETGARDEDHAQDRGDPRTTPIRSCGPTLPLPQTPTLRHGMPLTICRPIGRRTQVPGMASTRDKGSACLECRVQDRATGVPVGSARYFRDVRILPAGTVSHGRHPEPREAAGTHERPGGHDP